MAFIMGSEAIKAADKADQEARKAAFADRVAHFALKADQSVILRFFTPMTELISVRQHGGVKTKAAPAGATNWPAAMKAVCGYDPAVAAELNRNSCYVCDNRLTGTFDTTKPSRPSPRTWGYAIEREVVLGDGTPALGGPELMGRPVGYKDVEEEYFVRDKDGKRTEQKATRPKIVVVNQPWSNFWAALDHVASVQGDVRDRDFNIRRTGADQSTNYYPLPLDVIPDLKPGTPAWKVYEDEFAAREIDLAKQILDMASDAYYAQWFDSTKEVKEGKIVDIGQGAAPAVTGVGEVTEADAAHMESIRKRLSGS